MVKPPVGSRCPKCGELRVMDGYSSADLQRRLDTGQPIEGWCSTCDERWSFSEQERAGIVKGLAS